MTATTETIENKKTLDIEQIMGLLPHRFPFLMIDRVLDYEIEGEHKTLRAVKNVTFNEPFFQGHFPGRPIMPGVLIVESLAQAGGSNLDALLGTSESGESPTIGQ